MDRRASISNLTSRYDDFLFAPICEEENGMRLSVLSALARMDVDPWKEATRLAAMPKAIAETTLVSTLNRVAKTIWKPSEAEVIAARLIRLLPQKNESPTITATEIRGVRSHGTNYWVVWVAVAIAVSILSPHHQATTIDTSDSNSKPSVISKLKSSHENIVLPNVKGQPD